MTPDVINGVPRSLLERVAERCALVLSVADGEQLSAMLATAQPAADGEREAFEAWAASVGYHTERDMFQREKYQSSLTWELWRVWQARAAQPQQAVAVTDEVIRLREALERAKDHLSNARHDVEVRANAGSEAARLVLAGIDHWLAQEAAHKTGEEE